MDYLTDTTLLIDLWRERSKAGPAVRFVAAHSQSVVGLPWVAKGEFLRGACLAGQGCEGVDGFLSAFIVVWPTERTLRHYADLYAMLRKVNALIGPNDLWLAACAFEHGLPLLTRNVEEYARVEGLSVLDYRRGEDERTTLPRTRSASGQDHLSRERSVSGQTTLPAPSAQRLGGQDHLSGADRLENESVNSRIRPHPKRFQAF